MAAAAAASPSPPRALLIPFPAQGHVMPLMDLAHRLICCGFDITFVHTEYDRSRIAAASTVSWPQATERRIHVATVPDGLGPGDPRDDIFRLCDSVLRVVPDCLEQLIREEGEAGRAVTCVVADECMAWALDVAGKFGLPGAVLWPASAEILATMLSIPKLIEDGIIDNDLGMPSSKEPYYLVPGAPPMGMSAFVWTMIEDEAAKRSLFRYFCAVVRSTEKAKFILCNSFLELEQPAFAFAPRILPVGPQVLSSSSNACFGSRGSYWIDNRDCLRWLNTQPPRSVVYVSFGSLAVLGVRQFEELALGLELSGRPFLWVVRPGLIVDNRDGNRGALYFPKGFEGRVAGRGRTVEWAPQREVLAHPALACFLSHCGWNSITEGVGNGVPFLCWPYFLDQIINCDRICNIWRTGIRVDPDGDGLVLREQIKEKLDSLLGDEGIRVRAVELEEMARKNMKQGGASFENFNRFVHEMNS